MVLAKFRKKTRKKKNSPVGQVLAAARREARSETTIGRELPAWVYEELDKEEAAAWAESVRKYDLARVREKREAWVQHHCPMAAVHEALAARHRIALSRLIDGKA